MKGRNPNVPLEVSHRTVQQPLYRCSHHQNWFANLCHLSIDMLLWQETNNNPNLRLEVDFSFSLPSILVNSRSTWSKTMSELSSEMSACKSPGSEYSKIHFLLMFSRHCIQNFHHLLSRKRISNHMCHWLRFMGYTWRWFFMLSKNSVSMLNSQRRQSCLCRAKIV